MLEERLPALAGLQAARLARVAAERGCIEEADERLAFARVRVSRSDAAAAVELALAEARVALVHGRRDDAEHQLDAALAGVADSECLNLWAQTLALRAEIRDEEPVEALELYERKGNTAAAERLRELVNTRLPR
jgi:predicted negative regulator of RcsB-dependent stress response